MPSLPVPPSPTSPAAADRDPVCGMAVKPDSPYQANHAGQRLRFCSSHCLERFGAEPHKYLPAQHTDHAAPDAAAAAAVAATAAATAAMAATEYTCPMHPEIRQIGPGTCPICGMALEPVMPELEEEENPELRDFSRRFWWTLPLTVIVTVLAMGGHALNLFHGAAQNWVELALSSPVVLWAGWPFFVRGVRSVRLRSPNMWTLIGLGTAAAYLYSVVATLAPGVFPGRPSCRTGASACTSRRRR